MYHDDPGSRCSAGNRTLAAATFEKRTSVQRRCIKMPFPLSPSSVFPFFFLFSFFFFLSETDLRAIREICPSARGDGENTRACFAMKKSYFRKYEET